MLHEESSVTSRDFSGLPEPLSSALAEFCRHLSAERALSRHTVRAYQGDIQSLLEYAWWRGVGDPGSLDLTTLRGWLANQHQGGAARATLARRGAAARAFTAYAHRRGTRHATPPFLSCCTRRPFGSANFATSIPEGSTRSAARSACSARGTRSASCRWACPRCAP